MRAARALGTAAPSAALMCRCGHPAAEHAATPVRFTDGQDRRPCDGWHLSGGPAGMLQRCGCIDYRPWEPGELERRAELTP